MRYTLLSLFSILALAACSSAISMKDSSLKPGQYRILAIEIIPDPAMKSEDYKDFQTLQPILAQALAIKLTGKGSGQDALLSIQVKKLDMQINNLKALLLTDSYVIEANAIVMDSQTRRVLGSWPFINTSNSSDAFLTTLKDDISGCNKSVHVFADKIALRVANALYP